jgi:hypothetical protein
MMSARVDTTGIGDKEMLAVHDRVMTMTRMWDRVAPDATK